MNQIVFKLHFKSGMNPLKPKMNRDAVAAKIRDILLREDPMQLFFEDVRNVDEYDPEITAMLDQIETCRDESEVRQLVWNVFRRFFGDQGAGPQEKYQRIARQIWVDIQSVPPHDD